MKISASIYSNKKESLEETIQLLNASHVDMIHVDCNDDISVFDDIDAIKRQSDRPVDLHIITTEPEKYFDGIVRSNPELVTFQFEEIGHYIEMPSGYKGKKGLAITTNTPIDVFSDFARTYDFILFMATVPGQSGGAFDKSNFRKIREFQQRWPGVKIHVDGGVNPEVSFILRNMGVYASVSGSYLFNSQNISTALLNLKLKETESHFRVSDFMRTLEESPTVLLRDMNLQRILESMRDGGLGFTMVIDEQRHIQGIIGNADLRNGLLKHMDNLNELDYHEIINKQPMVVNENLTVVELLRFIKNQPKPILYLPVVNAENKVTGTISFMNLIKGEL